MKKRFHTQKMLLKSFVSSAKLALQPGTLAFANFNIKKTNAQLNNTDKELTTNLKLSLKTTKRCATQAKYNFKTQALNLLLKGDKNNISVKQQVTKNKAIERTSSAKLNNLTFQGKGNLVGSAINNLELTLTTSLKLKDKNAHEVINLEEQNLACTAKLSFPKILKLKKALIGTFSVNLKDTLLEKDKKAYKLKNTTLAATLSNKSFLNLSTTLWNKNYQISLQLPANHLLFSDKVKALNFSGIFKQNNKKLIALQGTLNKSFKAGKLTLLAKVTPGDFGIKVLPQTPLLISNSPLVSLNGTVMMLATHKI